MSDKNNTGNYNSGYRNSGDWNSGYRNSGDGNTGNRNSGDYNSGSYNTGDGNSGDCNTGDYNTGDYNTGNRNSGDGNSGDGNSGSYNSGNWNSGDYNTTEPTVLLFNKDTGMKRDDPNLKIKYPRLILNDWVEDETKAEGGYLKTYTYKEAWENYWGSISHEERLEFTNMTNFDPEVFKEITGIDVNSSTVEVVANGKKVEISSESAKALGLI